MDLLISYSFGASNETNQLLHVRDRYIFFIGGGISFVATLFLLIGSLRFRELRKQPGDLIIGIALSDMGLAIHWLLLSFWYKDVDNHLFCQAVGALGVFAAASEFVYNICFNLFLITSLRNALKQTKVLKKTFHLLALGVAGLFLGAMFYSKKVGRTFYGTCSIASATHTSLTTFLAPVIIFSYFFVGSYTLYYIRKNVPKCGKASTKRSQFLLYYSYYIVASIAIYSAIAITNLIFLVYRSSEFQSVHNVTKLMSPLFLTLIRYNDPLVKKMMARTIFFWRQSQIKKPLMAGQTTEMSHSVNANGRTAAGAIHHDMEGGKDEFVVNELTENKRVETVYTLLSCVLFNDFVQRNGVSDKIITTNLKHKNPYECEKLFQVADQTIKYLVPRIREEMDRVNYNILPGTLKVYSPEVFMQFVDDDKQFLNIQESLDFAFNREEIMNASAPGGGKSGEFFFFSKDRKLIIKTIPDCEMNMLIKILAKYEEHFRTNPNSLIAKIYGAFTYQSLDYEEKLNLIVMKNINGYGSKFIENVYDIKGSKFDREVLKGKGGKKEKKVKQSVLKDVDFVKKEHKLFLKNEFKEAFRNQIKADSQFFRSVKLIDYSFMVFCINKRKYYQENGRYSDGFVTKNRLAALEKMDNSGIVYHVGIVDYLQPYNCQKALEKTLKRISHFNPRLDTSSQNPNYYSERFIRFINDLVF